MDRRLCLGPLASLAVPGTARAACPDRIIRIVVPFPPGGTTDILARLVADRPGASGSIGTKAVAGSAPDGHTLVTATIDTHGTDATVFRSLPDDPVRDFAPVTVVASTPNVLPANPSLAPDAFGQMVRGGVARWPQIVAKTGVAVQQETGVPVQ